MIGPVLDQRSSGQERDGDGKWFPFTRPGCERVAELTVDPAVVAETWVWQTAPVTRGPAARNESVPSAYSTYRRPGLHDISLKVWRMDRQALRRPGGHARHEG